MRGHALRLLLFGATRPIFPTLLSLLAHGQMLWRAFSLVRVFPVPENKRPKFTTHQCGVARSLFNQFYFYRTGLYAGSRFRIIVG